MTSMTGVDDLNALLEERARYERWISQLTAKREQTPPHVFERVRTDYAARLDTVMTQLRSRADWLQGSATQLEERVAALSNEESLRRDARAEIELRAMVGEYTSDRAHEELAACDVDIGRLESERSVAAAELTRIQEILALVRQPAAKPAAPPPPAQASRPLGAPVTQREPDSTMQELAFLNSVVDRRDKEAPLPPVAAPVAARIEDIPLVTNLEAPEPQETAPVPREELTLRQAAGTPSFLKGMPTEQVKTLKCQECGTMNYPTEWYCERCGGELAAM
jgi:ribosomal protein L37E